jgi:hypothetical protein
MMYISFDVGFANHITIGLFRARQGQPWSEDFAAMARIATRARQNIRLERTAKSVRASRVAVMSSRSDGVLGRDRGDDRRQAVLPGVVDIAAEAEASVQLHGDEADRPCRESARSLEGPFLACQLSGDAEDRLDRGSPVLRLCERDAGSRNQHQLERDRALLTELSKVGGYVNEARRRAQSAGELCQSRFGNQSDELIPILHALVERRRPNADALRDSLHREARQPFRLEQIACSGDDLIERRSVWRGHNFSIAIDRSHDSYL